MNSLGRHFEIELACAGIVNNCLRVTTLLSNGKMNWCDLPQRACRVQRLGTNTYIKASMSTQADVYDDTEGHSLFMYDTAVSENAEASCIVGQSFIEPRLAFRFPNSVHPTCWQGNRLSL